MALLLRVLLVGVLAAAADDVPVTWSSGHVTLPCVAPLAERVQARRPPLPLDAGDEPPSRVLWRRNGEAIPTNKISPSGSLEVNRGSGDGEGVYQCLIRHYGGFVMGYPIHLKFASMENIFDYEPADATAKIGQPFLMECNISSAPPATYSWLKDDQPVKEDERHYVILNQLLILDVTTADEGSYRCVASNPHLNKTLTSKPGLLQVDHQVWGAAPGFLQVKQETNISAKKGGRVVLACPVTGWPRKKVIWKMTPPGEKTVELESEDQVLVSRSFQLDQEGDYFCSIEGHDELVKSFKVSLSPARITIPPTSREAVRASTVRFNCTAEGRPAPNITWYKDGKLLPIAGRISLKTSADQQRTELIIGGVTSEDAGVYQCFAQNAAATDSYWAMLNVTGANVAAPTNVQCWPINARTINVTWQAPVGVKVVAYTVHGQPEEEKAGRQALPGQPLNETHEIASVVPFVPYIFQVRAYLSNKVGKASDMSETVVCQGQGVPIKIRKLKGIESDHVLVSWRQFAKETPEVKQWILQTKEEGSGDVQNITLDGAKHNYSLYAPSSAPLLVRVLGSRDLNWLHQNLTFVQWTPTTTADDLEAGDLLVRPSNFVVTELGARSLTISWECVGADSRFTYTVCARAELTEEICTEQKEMKATLDNLSPGTQYRITVQPRIGNLNAHSGSQTVVTLTESPLRFRDLKADYVNASYIQVSWNGPPADYKVHYSAELTLPVEHWDSVDTENNTVLIPVIDPMEQTFLMVTGYDPLEHSRIYTVHPYRTSASHRFRDLSAHYINSSKILVTWTGPPAMYKVHYSTDRKLPVDKWHTAQTNKNSVLISVLNPHKKTYVAVSSYNPLDSSKILAVSPYKDPRSEDDLHHEVTRSGVRVWWSGDQPRVVQYSQNITTPLEQWTTLTVTGSSVELPVDVTLSTYVMVSQPNVRKTKIITIDPSPAQQSSLYIGIGIGVGVLVLGAMALAAVCIWRRRKKKNSPVRSRRRNDPANEENAEESEMKVVVGGGRGLANGDARGAGEPLLNGNVHITENPTIKTPNGKMKKARRYEAFDVSRREDPDSTMETVLEADSSASFFLDTSRRPEYDLSRSSREMSENNSFAKLPDDNMNSEVTRSSYQLDNSKIQPTLQPNG